MSKKPKNSKKKSKAERESAKMVVYSNDQTAEVKLKFEEKYKKILGEEKYKKLIEYFLMYPRKSIRFNTLKKNPEYSKKIMEKIFYLEKIPWSENSYWTEPKTERRDIGNTPAHSLGYIYIQEAASMLPVEVIRPYIKEDGFVFDMCAAPGSKTTQLAQLKNNKGLIIANELLGKRIASLGLNVQKCGATNVVITQHDAIKIKRRWENIKFDNILLDAPCSGTATIRKSLGTLKTWNPKIGIAMAKIQRKLLGVAFSLLKEGGVMTYSTCSIEPEENEGVIDWFLKKYNNVEILDIKVDVNRSDPILNYDGQEYDFRINKCLRIWPYDNNSDGFFVTLIKKLPERDDEK